MAHFQCKAEKHQLGGSVLTKEEGTLSTRRMPALWPSWEYTFAQISFLTKPASLHSPFKPVSISPAVQIRKAPHPPSQISLSFFSFLFSSVSLFHHLSELRFPSLFFVSGIQSAEEDSADQSPVESIPIRGKKADRRSARSGVLLCLFCLSPHAVDNGGPFFSQLDSCERMIKVNQRSKSHLKSGTVPLIIGRENKPVSFLLP